MMINIDKISPLVRQLYLQSAILCTVFSCGLGLGLFNVINDNQILKDDNWQMNEDATRTIEITGEIAFVPSIIIIPYIMQRKGRRKAAIATILPILLGWALMFLSKSLLALIVINALFSTSIGGAVAISSIIVSEFSAPKYRAAILMLETVILSFGVLISHICGAHSCLQLLPYVGIISALYALIVTYYWLESPYWLISQGHIEKSTENFYWIRGKDEDSRKEVNALLVLYKTKMQVDALKPIFKKKFRDRIIKYMKSLLSADFLRPLCIMILLFTFVVFAEESLNKNFSFRDLFNLSGKYNGTIVIDVITVLCAITSCVLLQLERRKTLFMITGSVAVLFLFLAGLYLVLQTFGILSPDYMWLYVTFGTLFAMFMSLGTTALPFSILGEIFPMTYKGVGSSLTCTYLWALGNTVIRFVPPLTALIGKYCMIFIFVVAMLFILFVVQKILPETHGKSLTEIEEYSYEVSKVKQTEIQNQSEEDDQSFDKLKLLIEYV